MAALDSIVHGQSSTSASLLVGVHASAYCVFNGGYTILSGGYSAPIEGVVSALPSIVGIAYGGASLSQQLPIGYLSSSGTVPVIGRVMATLPRLELAASGYVGGLSVADLLHGGKYPLSSFGGGYMAGTHMGGYTLVSTGVIGGIGEVQATLSDPYVLQCSVTQENYGACNVVLPSLTAVPSGQAWLVAPSLNLHAIGGEVVTATYEAYATNLKTGAVTHYTNYPFDNILRFGSSYYGISSQGVFKLDGELDLTDDIEATIKTFYTILGSQNQKRVPYIYASGRSSGGVIISVTVDEGDTYEYESDWGDIPGPTNHRTAVGKGIRGVYYSVGIKNTAGGSLELDSIDAHVAPTQRAI